MKKSAPEPGFSKDGYPMWWLRFMTKEEAAKKVYEIRQKEAKKICTPKKQ